jgi:hypothetical protein
MYNRAAGYYQIHISKVLGGGERKEERDMCGSSIYSRLQLKTQGINSAHASYRLAIGWLHALNTCPLSLACMHDNPEFK